MTTESDEGRIEQVLERRAAAIRAKDAAGVLACHTGEGVIYSLAPPLRQEADDGGRLRAWFATWQGPIGYELRDIAVEMAGGLALAHGFVRISGTKTDGQRNDVWARQTIGLRRIGRDWKIIHEHTSVPFYMDGSLRAAVDLTP